MKRPLYQPLCDFALCLNCRSVYKALMVHEHRDWIPTCCDNPAVASFHYKSKRAEAGA